MEALPHNSRHRGNPSGDFGESVSSSKQTCPWMHSRAPTDQEDTCPLAKQGPPATPATPHLETLQPCTDPPWLPSAPAPSQPLRMAFTRLDRSCWRSWFLAAPSFLPPEKPGPAQGPPAPHLSDGACVCGPWSVLHSDLQVSSSSEDSESE
ncbi:Protein FAM90A17 [Vulpes lagopus]